MKIPHFPQNLFPSFIEMRHKPQGSFSQRNQAKLPRPNRLQSVPLCGILKKNPTGKEGSPWQPWTISPRSLAFPKAPFPRPWAAPPTSANPCAGPFWKLPWSWATPGCAAARRHPGWPFWWGICATTARSISATTSSWAFGSWRSLPGSGWTSCR